MIISGENLKIESLVNIAKFGEKVEIDASALTRVQENRENLERLIARGNTIYGVNTGLGELVKVKIHDDEIIKLQRNLVRSHSSGVGKNIPDEIIRGAILIRLNSLLKGYSGVRREVVNSLIEFLNRGITPIVPEYGSVGASGDLAPLAHIALTLMGEGKVKYNGIEMNTHEALSKAGIEPLSLQGKEGLALLNGTSVMASYASFAIWESYRIMENALLSTAMSFEALHATDRALDDRIMKARPHPGQIEVARILRELLEDSTIVKQARNEKVQDAYTLRCTPQVYGAVLDTLNYVKKVIERELNSATDNPLIFDEAISGGNFHGEPIAFAMDFLSIALTDLGNIIERRIARLIDSKLSGLPAFLVKHSGLNSGLMIPQYTAAMICTRNKVLSHPASTDTIPTSANQEDHVSMGMVAAQKLYEIVNNVKYIIAIEYLCANQALHLNGSSASAVKRAMTMVNIPVIEEDSVFSEYIEEIKKKIDDDKIINNFNIKIGP